MMEYPQEFLALLQPGKTLRLFYNAKNVNNRLMHVRAVVDDSQIVYRVWSHKRGWVYQIESRYSLHWQWTHGILTMASSRQKETVHVP